MMTEPADTRESLLIRLRDGSCDSAWSEFTDIYRPMILRLARQSGLQFCDAEDVTQRVMVSVSKSIGDWRKDPARGNFRGWLTVVTRNAIRNAVRRSPVGQTVGSQHMLRLLSDVECDAEFDRHIETEFMRSVFRSAAKRVQQEFAPATWDAFWRTTADDKSVSEAASILNTSTGSVYAARSRVMRRLQRVTRDILAEEEWL